jgi:hypothetical protein
MKNPKEKANELIDLFIYNCRECDYIDNARESAVRLCNEMLSLGALIGNDLSDSFYLYWGEVKKHLTV